MDYLLDTHVHTSEVSECAHVAARDVVRLYVDSGYDGIVITDHYYEGFFNRLAPLQLPWEQAAERYLEGYHRAAEAGAAAGLDVYLGAEMRFSAEGYEDYLVFGLTEAVLVAYPRLYLMALADFRELADEHDLGLFQAHPFRPGQRAAAPGTVHGFEVHNGNPRQSSNNDLAEALAAERGVPSTSGSDFHQPEDIARGGVKLRRRPADNADLAHSLVSGRISGLVR